MSCSLGRPGGGASTGLGSRPATNLGRVTEPLGFSTRAIHAGPDADPAYGAVTPPIYATSTYAQSSPGVHQGFEYSRTHLAGYKRVRRLQFTDLPKTISGKIRRVELRRGEVDNGPSVDFPGEFREDALR